MVTFRPAFTPAGLAAGSQEIQVEMNHLFRLTGPGFVLLFTLAVLLPATGRASYHFFNVASGSVCILQDYRSPDVPPGIYDAEHEENVTSSDGGSAYFYGGFTHQNLVNSSTNSLVQYVCWPASGWYPPYCQQIPIFAGTNMVGYPQIGEGSSCAIKGYWPQFRTNLWTREATRYWPPANGLAHVGYQGEWIKEPVSGNWYHVGTFLYPFAVKGVQGMSGWQEDFDGYAGVYIADYANGYYYYGGQWRAANQIQFTPEGPSDCYLINNGAGAESQVSNPNLTANAPITLTLTNQPAAPAFDPILITNYRASLLNTQLLVQWQVPLPGSPQLSYLVQVFTNPNYTGSPAVSFFDNAPDTRQTLLTVPAGIALYVSLTITDIFFNASSPLPFTATNVAAGPATSVAGTAGGLGFQYYESSYTNWTSLPDFSTLTPVYRGAVNYPDQTPRRVRTNYGFTYNGYLTVPATGMYAFTLYSGDGAGLTIDGTTVIDFDGLHDWTQFMGGGMALAAGQHTFRVQYFKGAANPVNPTAYNDGMGLFWQGPGFAYGNIPASAFSRIPGASEPAIAMLTPANGATVGSLDAALTASITANGNTINKVMYYLTDYDSYYFRPTSGVDYYVGQSTAAPFAVNCPVWSALTNGVRARVYYNSTNILDSAVSYFATTNVTAGAWQLLGNAPQNYPAGGGIQAGHYTLTGDNVTLQVLPVKGDCTLIAHLATQTGAPGAPDLAPPASWMAGIIMRGTTNTNPGQPLGDATSPFCYTSVFSDSSGGGTFYEDDTMLGGNAAADATSPNLGAYQWFEIQRSNNLFTLSVSPDGNTWSVVQTNTLTGMPNELYAGLFLNSIPSQNPNLNFATFDYVSLTGTNVMAPAGITVSPGTNAVVGGLPARFTAAVIGPSPAGYQWQLNGTNIPGATNESYSIASVSAGSAGDYTVLANSVTSAPAILLLAAAAGSGIWTNPAGGSWASSNNWSGGIIAAGTDAVANFSTLSLNRDIAVTLDGTNSVGWLLLDDLNQATPHTWTLNSGTGGPLTLAVSAGTPGIAVLNPYDSITAVVAGAQGFTKTGPGYLTLSGNSTVTGGLTVAAGTLEMQGKSGDTTYAVGPGATLKIGYSTGGGYANTAMTVNGSGVSSTNGFYLLGGRLYNTAGTITLLSQPTTVRQYGSGYAELGTFDINSGQGLYCAASASGSIVSSNIELVSDGYGMIGDSDPGTNTAAGDLAIDGPLNVGGLGFYKRGKGSILLNGVAAAGNTAVQIEEGTIICGVTNCLGMNASVPIASGGSLELNGFNETVASLSTATGGTVSFGGTNTLMVASATLGGTLQFGLNQGGIPGSSELVSSNPLVFGGTLAATNIGTELFAAGDTFTLFNAPGYSGTFSSFNLPALPVGLMWNTISLPVNGTLKIVTNGLSVWNGGGANSDWSTAANWSGTPPTNGQLLTFAGTTRQNNTNNFLSGAGQVIFANGGFQIAGNPLSLQWGLVNEAGTNLWGIGTTLFASQSFYNSNGVLIIAGAVTNSGFTFTLDGAGSNSLAATVSGAGGLVKNGPGNAAISVQQTYTGNTTISNGMIDLTGGGGSASVIYGTVNIFTGGALRISTGDGFGYNGGATALTVLNVTGGTLAVNSTANQTLGNAVITLAGGNLTGPAGGNLDFFLGGSALNSLASSNTSVISGIPLSPLRQGSTTFTVDSGTTASGIDLDIQSVLRTSPSGDASGAVFYKSGPGTMRLGARNTFARPTTVNGGTLLVDGWLTASSNLTVLAGATLGGNGVVAGPTTVSPGGTLAPGFGTIGTLTVGNALTLAGNALLKISRNGGQLSNDMASVAGALTLGGSLIVTNIGINAVAAGDHFTFFTAGSFFGNFTNFSLPPLSPGLLWYTNTVAVNGTIAVSNLTLTLLYTAGPDGTLGGVTTQTVGYGADGTTVTAVADSGYYFLNWSDGSVANPRTETDVTNNVSVTANFAAGAAGAPVWSGNPVFRGDQLLFTFTGTDGQSYKILTTTNLALPTTNWASLATGTFGGHPITFTNLITPGSATGFFRITSP